MARAGQAQERRAKPATPEPPAGPTTFDALRVSARRVRGTGRVEVEFFDLPERKTDRPSLPMVHRTRCNRCRRWAQAGAVGGRALGLDSYCGSCIDELVCECQDAHEGRLPKRGAEFYCRHCREIRPLELLTPPDHNGRRRWICWPCRRTQVAKAGARRHRRRDAAKA